MDLETESGCRQGRVAGGLITDLILNEEELVQKGDGRWARGYSKS